MVVGNIFVVIDYVFFEFGVSVGNFDDIVNVRYINIVLLDIDF